MSLLTNQTSLNSSEFFFLRGTGQQINVSTLNANTISTNTLTANSTIANQLSTILLDANDINASTIFAYEVFIDNQGLTATPTELLLNGVPIATTANLSSIQDWAAFPATSTINAAGNNLISTNNIVASNVNAQTGMFQNLFANNIFAFSTYTSTVSSLAEVADFGFIGQLSTGSATGGDFAPSSLWGQTSSFYQDLVSSISSLSSDNITCSTLTAANSISTPALEVSSINGSEFNSTGIVVQVAGVSSLVANSISSIGAELRTALVSTLQFNPSFSPNLDVNLGLGSLFGNLAGAAAGGLGVLVGGAALGTGIAALAQGRQTNYINSNAYELVNGTTQLQISTLGDSFSTIYRFVSSSAENVPGEEIFISTISPAGLAIRSMSDPLNTTSSPNSTIQAFGQWVALPEIPAASTISSFSDVFTSSIGVSTLLTNYQTGIRGSVPFLDSTPGVSTVEVFTAAAPEYSGSLRANQIVLSYAGLTGNDFAQDVSIVNYAGSANPPRLSVSNNNTGNAQIAYLTDIPGITSSYTQLFTQNLDVSTINFPTGTGSINGDDAYTVIQGINSLTAKNCEFSTIQGEGSGNLQITTPATAPVLNASTLNISTAKVQGQIIIEPSTTRSGIYMPFDATNGTGVVAVGLSTSVSIYEKYAAFLALSAQAFGESAKDTAAFLQTTDNEVSFQYADVEVGRLLVGGQNNYGANPTGYITGDTAGNLRVVAPSLNTSTMVLSTLQIAGISTISFSTSTAAGGQGQTAGRLVMGGCDLDIGQNDLWAQQIRLGAGNPSGSAQTEIIFYDPTAATQRGLNLANQDRTLRVVSTINGGSGGYILDSGINPPFFSTINNQVNLMSWFPSTNTSTIGVSTLSKMNPVSLYGRSTLAGGTLTVVFSPPYADSNEYSVQLTYKDSAGGAPLHANILSISSFSANGSATNDFFWTTIGRV